MFSQVGGLAHLRFCPPPSATRPECAGLTCAFATAERNQNASGFKAYAGLMTYIPERLTSLRQEITDLRNMNAIYSQRRAHSPIEQPAAEVRAGRLLQIKQELSKMLNRPDEVPSVWWENARRAKSVS
jgi:hypothetical protein